MSTEWLDLPTMADVARAQVEGWEIEVQTDAGNDKYCPWKIWNCIHWHSGYLYRGRPKQPKTRRVKMLCWFDGNYLNWRRDTLPPIPVQGFIRVPAEDKEIEVNQ